MASIIQHTRSQVSHALSASDRFVLNDFAMLEERIYFGAFELEAKANWGIRRLPKLPRRALSRTFAAARSAFHKIGIVADQSLCFAYFRSTNPVLHLIQPKPRNIGFIPDSPVTMPGGEYVLGDPIYTLRTDIRQEYVQNRSHNRTPFTIQDRMCLAFSTGADGIYLDQHGFEYYVDSAAIALLPVEITDVDEFHRPLVNIITFDEQFTCLYEPQHGRMRFGHIDIQLG